jgi:hypothetical protein
MRQIIFLPVFAAALLLSINGKAQVTTSATVDKINQANANVNATAASATQTAGTVKNVFAIFKGAKKEKKPDKVLIIISNVEYGDDDLLLLESAFEAVKDVKGVTKTMKEGLITIEVKYKEDANKLWKGIPVNLQKLFKPLQVEEKNMLLEYKNKTVVENTIPVNETKADSNKTEQKKNPIKQL